MRRLIALLSILTSTAVVAVAAVVVAQPPTPQQQPPPFTDRAEVSSIVVDVRVIDEFGAAVLGLVKPDFFVTIGGKPVAVQQSVWTGDAAETAPLGGRSSGTAAGEPGQLVVLLFQKSLVNERARGYIRMVNESRSLVRSLPRSARVAILQFDTSLKIWSDFTDDRDAIDRILANRLLRESAPASVPQGEPSLVKGLTTTPRRIGTIENAFTAVAEAMQPLSGSKAIAFIGYGMGATPFGARRDVEGNSVHPPFGEKPQDLADNGRQNTEFAKAWRALTAARVSVFSLDITAADTHSMATGMQTIAAETGGFYSLSLDFPERPMQFVAGALNGHYVLFVEPPVDPVDRTVLVLVNTDRRAYVYSTSSYRSRNR